MTDDYIAQTLASVEVGGSESPGDLRRRAQAVMGDFATAVMAPSRLAMEASLLRARADAIEKRDAARAPLAEAQARVEQVEAAFAATEPAELDAVRRGTAAHHEFERARDAYEQAKANRAEPAALIELDLRTESAARVSLHEEEALAAVRAGREAGRRAVEAARALRDQAQAALDAAEAQIGAPLTGERDFGSRLASLIGIWPVRVALRNQPGYELDEVDLAICSWMCEAAAAELGVVPAGAAERIAVRERAAAVKQLGQFSVALPSGGSVPLAALLGQTGHALGG